VVAGRDDVDAGRQQRLRDRDRQSHAAGEVLAVRGHEVDAALLSQRGQQLLDGDAARLADDVADDEDPARAGRSWRVAVRRVPQSRAPDGRFAGGAVRGYLAYSTARVSRITVTLI
jgi:hypothetical protein